MFILPINLITIVHMNMGERLFTRVGRDSYIPEESGTLFPAAVTDLGGRRRGNREVMVCVCVCEK